MLILKVLDPLFSVCKASPLVGRELIAAVSQELLRCQDDSECCVSLTRSDEELSVVLRSDRVPFVLGTVEHEEVKTWRAFRVEGQLDFSLVGVLSTISGLLASKEISIFVISTFNTDYFFVKEDKLESALLTLRAHGMDIR